MLGKKAPSIFSQMVVYYWLIPWYNALKITQQNTYNNINAIFKGKGSTCPTENMGFIIQPANLRRSKGAIWGLD